MLKVKVRTAAGKTLSVDGVTTWGDLKKQVAAAGKGKVVVVGSRHGYHMTDIARHHRHCKQFDRTTLRCIKVMMAHLILVRVTIKVRHTLKQQRYQVD